MNKSNSAAIITIVLATAAVVLIVVHLHIQNQEIQRLNDDLDAANSNINFLNERIASNAVPVKETQKRNPIGYKA